MYVKTTTSVLAAREAMDAGRLSLHDYVEASLERIAECDAQVGCWQSFDADKVRQALHQLPPSGPAAGRRLAGIPVAIKDNMDTLDYPATYGSDIYAGHRPVWDAACVALLREAGAVVMGKTVSTEFAYYKPGGTRNPHDMRRTPGGSSSGSAAAVAAGMVPLALGTQTAGSVIRPASFCGVVGYKPSFGWIARAGVKALADSLDTVGVFATTVADAALAVAVMSGRTGLIPPAAAHSSAHASVGPSFRIGVCTTPVWTHAGPGTRHVFERVGAMLTGALREYRDVALPPAFIGLADAQKAIMAFESRYALAHEYRLHADKLSAQLHSLLEEGMGLSMEEVKTAYARASECRAVFSAWMDEQRLDALLVPSAVDEAPLGLEATGDPVFSRIWTLLGTPCVNVPGLYGPNGMPVGVQVVGRHGDDACVLAVAAALSALIVSA